MKMFSKRLMGALFLGIVFAICMQPQKAAAQYGDQYVSYQTFYDDLSPFGQWIEDPQYGYVWAPDVASDFRPYYTNGNWAMTEYGNTWVSSYPWGWATFHYGRWTYDPYYGWLWIPGNQWGPSWVSWRYGGGYYGWAPLGPGFEVGTGYGGYYDCPSDWWVFTPPQYLYGGNYYHYWNGPRYNNEYINNTTFVNNTYVQDNHTYVTGPRAAEVQQVTGQPVKVYHLANTWGPRTPKQRGDIVKLYHPMQVRQNEGNGQMTAPAAVVRAPQLISAPQSTANRPQPQFRNDVRANNVPVVAPSAPRYNEPQKAPAQEAGRGRYEWDVNRPQPQQAQPRREPVQQQPQPVRAQPQPQQQSAPRQQAPAPRQAPTPAPARSNSGSRR